MLTPLLACLEHNVPLLQWPDRALVWVLWLPVECQRASHLFSPPRQVLLVSHGSRHHPQHAVSHRCPREWPELSGSSPSNLSRLREKRQAAGGERGLSSSCSLIDGAAGGGGHVPARSASQGAWATPRHLTPSAAQQRGFSSSSMGAAGGAVEHLFWLQRAGWSGLIGRPFPGAGSAGGARCATRSPTVSSAAEEMALRRGRAQQWLRGLGHARVIADARRCLSWFAYPGRYCVSRVRHPPATRCWWRWGRPTFLNRSNLPPNAVHPGPALRETRYTSTTG
jgi:hypothetical protein